MALADLIDKAHTRPPGMCTICWLLNVELDADTAKALRDAMAHPGIPFVDIASSEELAGYGLTSERVSRHARGTCSAKEVLR